MMIVFLDFVPMCTNPCFQLLGAWEYFTCAEEKTLQKLHAIIRFLCKCVNTFWLGSFQGTEVAFYVFDSTWEGKEGDKSHPLWVWKIRSKNMAYTCVHVLQIHVCHLETCKSRHDICLRDGSEACRKIWWHFLRFFLAQETELSFGSEQHEHCALSPKARWYGWNEVVMLLLPVLFEVVWQHLESPAGCRDRQNSQALLGY